jgi:uncharacterized membrane protein YcaP (DUF421 family)
LDTVLHGIRTIGLRSALLYVLTLVAVRVMGKRSVSEMAPFDLTVVIIMGSVAALPLEDLEIPIQNGIIPIVIMSLLHFLLSVVNLHFREMEKITQGTSTPIVVNGQVLRENLKKERISDADLHILLRHGGAENLEDIALAVLEPNGEVTVIKKKDAQPLTPKDLDLLTLTKVDSLRGQMQDRLLGSYREVISRVPKRTWRVRRRIP